MSMRRLGSTATLLALLLAVPLFAQRGDRIRLDDDEPIRPIRGEDAVPPPPMPDGNPVVIPGLEVEAPTPPAPTWMINPKVDFAFLPQWANKRNASIGEFDWSAPMVIPLGGDMAPLQINPVVAQRFWAGPKPVDGLRPSADVPGALYEFYADFRWRPRLAEWFFLDMRITPGFYSDMQNTGTDAFLPRGYILGVFAFSEKFQFLAGVASTNRVLSQMVPIGGFNYTPDEDTEFRLVFPVPRMAVCIDKQGDTKYWLHLSGEWGGGAWGVQREGGFNDKLDYSDARLYTGIESRTKDIVTWHAEIGFVFDRRLTYKSNRPEQFRLGETFIARVGFSF